MLLHKIRKCVESTLCWDREYVPSKRWDTRRRKRKLWWIIDVVAAKVFIVLSVTHTEDRKGWYGSLGPSFVLFSKKGCRSPVPSEDAGLKTSRLMLGDMEIISIRKCTYSFSKARFRFLTSIRICPEDVM